MYSSLYELLMASDISRNERISIVDIFLNIEVRLFTNNHVTSRHHSNNNQVPFSKVILHPLPRDNWLSYVIPSMSNLFLSIHLYSRQSHQVPREGKKSQRRILVALKYPQLHFRDIIRSDNREFSWGRGFCTQRHCTDSRNTICWSRHYHMIYSGCNENIWIQLSRHIRQWYPD